MKNITAIKSLLKKHAQVQPEKQAAFFKTGVGHYAEHDVFIGVTVPKLRKIAKQFQDLSLVEIKVFLVSPVNEERFLALVLLVNQYQKFDPKNKTKHYQFYLRHLKYVNNWNLVDASAHLIMGAYLLKISPKEKTVLTKLAKSKSLWERRVAIVSTWYFIRNNELAWTFKLAKILLKDDQDLIHKAVGWMLREAGKRDEHQLIGFLDQYVNIMPRTMLRYAIEKFPERQRKAYLNLK